MRRSENQFDIQFNHSSQQNLGFFISLRFQLSIHSKPIIKTLKIQFDNVEVRKCNKPLSVLWY